MSCFKKKTVIIVGDLNLDRLRLDRSEGKILRDLEEASDLHCLINEPTRVTANSQTLIDVMLTNNPALFKNCGVYNPEISDHSMIYGEMTEKVKKHTSKTLVHLQTKTTDFDNFNKDLIDAPWHVGEIFDLDDAYDYWRNRFDSIANKHATMTKKRVLERDVCFMTKEWKAAIRNKRKYAIQFAKYRTPENFELKKRYRNIATRERRKAVTAHWYKKSEEMKSKPHDVFDIFRPFLNNKTKDSNPIFLKNKHEDGIIEDQRQVAETLAIYFSTIASDIGGNHVIIISLTENEFNNHSSVQMIETIYSNSSFQFKRINTKDVMANSFVQSALRCVGSHYH